MIGLIAGILLGIALALIRLTIATSNMAILLALGLSLLEIAAILMLHWISRVRTEQQRAHEESLIFYNKKVALLRSAEQEVNDLKMELAELKNEQASFLSEVYLRAHHHRQVERLVEAAKAAIRDGYLAGTAENLGKLRH